MVSIQTQRIIIRELCDSDYPEFETTLNEIQKTVLGSGKGFMDWCISQYKNMNIKDGLLSYGMFSKETKHLLGSIGIGRHDDLHEPEIFYFLLPQYRGQGYTTEAAKAIIQWAFKTFDIPYLIGTATVDNIKSQKVLERCGFNLVDIRTLLVHAENKSYDFKYYRFYREQLETKPANN